MKDFSAEAGSFLDFARSYTKYGLNINAKGDLEYREWAPGAKELSLVINIILNIQFGDFNGWNRDSHKCIRDDYGVWTLILPKNADGTLPIAHESKFKVCITKPNWEKVDRVPTWAKYARQNSHNLLYEAVLWNPEEKY